MQQIIHSKPHTFADTNGVQITSRNQTLDGADRDAQKRSRLLRCEQADRRTDPEHKVIVNFENAVVNTHFVADGTTRDIGTNAAVWCVLYRASCWMLCSFVSLYDVSCGHMSFCHILGYVLCVCSV